MIIDGKYELSGHDVDYGLNVASIRFWSKVAITADITKCWIWGASKNKKGYGHFGFNGRMYQAHRFAYKLYYGDYDEILQCLHKCDNPSCVNPNHLWLGTNTDNVLDMVAKGRNKYCKGEKNGNSKLTEKDVIEIRNIYSTGSHSFRSLAKMYGIHNSVVGDIVNRNNWKNL
jgi:hypothetical protein